MYNVTKDFNWHSVLRFQVEETGDTRIVIDGDHGRGKTTFIKRLCYIWAQSVIHPEERDTEDEYLYKYTLVIPIILRFVKEENTLMDIITSQFECLNICQACAVINLFENKPSEVLLLLDGYDEYTGHSKIISKVIKKEECTEILIITTSRPHAVEQLRRHTSQAVDQLIRLCGFSEEQVKQYIRQFCEYHRLPSEKGEELIDTLSWKRRDILEVAKIPIRTEMICAVWAEYRKLGEKLADLYEMFVAHSITHWETKKKREEETEMSPEQVIEQEKALLLKIGQLANTWEKHNRMKIVFSTEELNQSLGKGDFGKVKNIGFLFKSHPSSSLQVSKWSFPHLTIQEYFVAFVLGRDTNDTHIRSFVKRCKNDRALRRCDVIFEFLCCKYPSAANKILTELLLEEKDEQKCQELFEFVRKVYRYYTKNTIIDIPLPHHLKLDSDVNVGKNVLNTLLKSDKKQKQPNLRYLTIEDLDQYGRFMDVPYIEGFRVTIKNEEKKKLVSDKIQKLSKLTSISINSELNLHSTDHTDILKNISCDRLTDLSVTAPDDLKAVADSIHRFKALQKLHVHDFASKCRLFHSYLYEPDTDRSSVNTHEYNILTALNNNNNVKEVSLCLPDLDDKIIQEKFNMKVKLQVKWNTLRKNSLRKAVRGLDFTGGLYKLDLSKNNLEYEGESLGQLMARMTTLRVLDVFHCNIKPVTVYEMVRSIKRIKVTSGLHALYMGCADLHYGGCDLGELITLIPDLYTLDLSGCFLTDTDLVNMSEAVPATTSIHKLNLRLTELVYSNEMLVSPWSYKPHLHDDNSEGLVSLLSHTPHIQALGVGGAGPAVSGSFTPVPVPSLCRAAVTGSLTSLHVLDMSWSELQPGSLEKLGQHLQYMDKLQVINLKEIQGVKPEDYQHVYSNLPPSIQHLNVCTTSDIIKQDVYLILDHKDNLNYLHRLNVNLYDSDIELLQEVLEQNNPHIHVYYDRHEDTWGMYVKEKGELNNLYLIHF